VIGAGATSGGAMDASNLLKPALSGGTIRCIGSTTYKEFRNHFEKDRALLRRFQKIDVNEPTIEDTVKILAGLRTAFEDHHSVKYTPMPSRRPSSFRRATSTTASSPTRRST
jgi:ATP-dependent Clp protease ATP-binding subunit ClpA